MKMISTTFLKVNIMLISTTDINAFMQLLFFLVNIILLVGLVTVAVIVVRALLKHQKSKEV